MSLTGHAPHLVLVAGGSGVLLWAAAAHVRAGRRVARLRRSRSPEDVLAAAELRAAQAFAVRPGRTATTVCALATGFAGVVHAAVVPDHLEEATRFGVFFAALAVLQLAACGVLLAGDVPVTLRHRIVAVSGAMNAAVVVLWAISRSTTFPLGPEEVEHLGLLDTACSLAELVAVAGAVRWWRVTRAATGARDSPVSAPGADARAA